jgi:hypothetical protein
MTTINGIPAVVSTAFPKLTQSGRATAGAVEEVEHVAARRRVVAVRQQMRTSTGCCRASVLTCTVTVADRVWSTRRDPVSVAGRRCREASAWGAESQGDQMRRASCERVSTRHPRPWTRSQPYDAETEGVGRHRGRRSAASRRSSAHWRREHQADLPPVFIAHVAGANQLLPTTLRSPDPSAPRASPDPSAATVTLTGDPEIDVETIDLRARTPSWSRGRWSSASRKARWLRPSIVLAELRRAVGGPVPPVTRQRRRSRSSSSTWPFFPRPTVSSTS